MHDDNPDVRELVTLSDRIELTIERHLLRTRRTQRLVHLEAWLASDSMSKTDLRTCERKALQLGGALIKRARCQLKRRNCSHAFNPSHVARSRS